MNSQQVKLVQSSFELVRPIADTAAHIFYDRLFTLDPSLRPMFKGDMAAQGRMLMSVLGVAVKGLTDLDALAPVLRGLGARHVDYGVRDEHYITVGTASSQCADTTSSARGRPGSSSLSERSQAAMHANGLRPSGTYSVDATLNEEQHKRLSAWIKEKTGPSRAGDPLVLDRNAKWLPTSQTGVDAQHVETRRDRKSVV